MNKELKGFGKVFSFTFRNHIKTKGYKTSIIAVALLCLLIPALVMTGIEAFSNDGASTKNTPEGQHIGSVDEGGVTTEEETADPSQLETVYLVDLTEDMNVDLDGLKEMKTTAEGEENPFAHVSYKDYGKDLDKALDDGKGREDTLILVASAKGSEYVINLLIPEESQMEKVLGWSYESVLDEYVSGIVDQKNSTADQSAGSNGSDMEDGDSAEGTEGEEKEMSPMDNLKEILSMIIPFLNIMVLYFFVLIYGQGVANSVIMEKNSKLMDVFLISVRPSAMILGKLLATGLAGIMQLFVWIGSLVLGFTLGTVGVKMINPESDMILIALFKNIGNLTSGMFSIGGILLAVLMVISGMFLYCSLAAIGGALAGKPEDLSSTNIMFTLILVASFLGTFYAGGLEGMSKTAGFLDWIPFTAIMVTPSRILLGGISLMKGLGSLAVVVVTGLIINVIAGRLYKAMALYKGDLPSLKTIFGMVKGS